MYPKGIKFECEKCGLCCGDTKNKLRMILFLKSEAKRISEKTSLDIDCFSSRTNGFEPYQYVMKKTITGKCFFLHNMQCTIYEDRPLICKFYPFQLIDLGDNHFVFKETDECLSINKGIPLRKIFFKKMFDEAMLLLRNEKT